MKPPIRKDKNSDNRTRSASTGTAKMVVADTTSTGSKTLPSCCYPVGTKIYKHFPRYGWYYGTVMKVVVVNETAATTGGASTATKKVTTSSLSLLDTNSNHDTTTSTANDASAAAAAAVPMEDYYYNILYTDNDRETIHHKDIHVHVQKAIEQQQQQQKEQLNSTTTTTDKNNNEDECSEDDESSSCGDSDFHDCEEDDDDDDDSDDDSEVQETIRPRRQSPLPSRRRRRRRGTSSSHGRASPRLQQQQQQQQQNQRPRRTTVSYCNRYDDDVDNVEDVEEDTNSDTTVDDDDDDGNEEGNDDAPIIDMMEVEEAEKATTMNHDNGHDHLSHPDTTANNNNNSNNSNMIDIDETIHENSNNTIVPVPTTTTKKSTILSSPSPQKQQQHQTTILPILETDSAIMELEIIHPDGTYTHQQYVKKRKRIDDYFTVSTSTTSSNKHMNSSSNKTHQGMAAKTNRATCTDHPKQKGSMRSSTTRTKVKTTSTTTTAIKTKPVKNTTTSTISTSNPTTTVRQTNSTATAQQSTKNRKVISNVGTTKSIKKKISVSASGGSSANSKSNSSSSGTTTGKSIIYDKKPYSNGKDLEVISDIQQMFDDMIQKKILGNDTFTTLLCQLLQKTNGTTSSSSTSDGTNVNIQQKSRPIKVATMCSGTESPILALDMIQNAIHDAAMTCRMYHGNKDTATKTMSTTISPVFQQFVASTFPETSYEKDSGKTSKVLQQQLLPIQHVFSCEIEPYKQAYIERNFVPPLLFRDIRELGNDHAYTAYGSYVPVPNTPGCVDILIAGTSCVDYSNLNNQKKNMEEKGESGATFYGMIRWIKKARPPIVIIENVYGAPWNDKVKIFEDLGYSATFLRLDTKDYYIPHTRQRGYLFAVLRPLKKGSESKDDPRTNEWADVVTALKRPASASVDDFMLPNDDPRVLRGRARLTVEASEGDTSSSRAGRVDWTKCETRHVASRSLEELGDKRPLTDWSDSGSTSLPSFCWNEWCNVQVHRIHDLMDVNTLRLAKVGMDCTYKTMVWNLSQNVDRDTMGKLGICQCLTPTGVPYVTNRGGPLVGEELLMLQGIPVDDLLLTKETEDNLKDLAGNAMSTTVVGACALCALLVGQDALSMSHDEKGSQSESQIMPSLVPRPLESPSEVQISDQFCRYEENMLNSATDDSMYSWSEFLLDAAMSAKMCVSEGEDEALPIKSIAKCESCGHTASISNAFPSRRYEEHEFQIDAISSARVDPLTFRRKLLDILPMRVVVAGVNLEDLSQPINLDPEIWMKWKESVASSLNLPNGEAVEFRFTTLQRSYEWIAIYSSQYKARLEVRISRKNVTWLAFVSHPATEGQLKLMLAQPFARMRVSALADGTFSMVKGAWEICLPVTTPIKISVSGIGRQLPSWRNRLGLKGKFENEFQYETLRISVESSISSTLKKMKEMIDGDYTLLPKCGGACGSLRRRMNSTDDNEELYFFLESRRSTLSCDDKYVISPQFHRTGYREYRETYLEIDGDYTPLHFGEKSSSHEAMILCSSFGCWTQLDNAELREVSCCSTSIRSPVGSIAIPMKSDGWKVCPNLLSVSLQVSTSDELVTNCLKLGGSIEVNLLKSSKVMKDIAFSTSRWRLPTKFSEGEWLSLQSTVRKNEFESLRSYECAPMKPQIKWTLVSKGKRATFIPLEDGKEAAIYERSLKARPKPWLLRIFVTRIDEAASSASLSIQIGCNVVSIVQRALGLIPESSMARKSLYEVLDVETIKYKYEWRIVLHKDVGITFPTLTFLSNKLDSEACQPPHFKKYPLRKEQLRSLTWMLKQEAATEPFYEEEVAEAVFPSLNWRLEGRVQRPVLVRGGIIADEVGYGKTAITLGLIDAAESVNGSPPDPPSDYRTGFIHTKATLVVVPKHLMGQWPDEVSKFVGSSKKVCVVQDLNSLNKMTIRDFQSADIVIVSFAVLNNETYFARLAKISGINADSVPTGSGSSRHFAATYNKCVSALPSQVANIKANCSEVYTRVSEKTESFENMNPNSSVILDGKKNQYKQGKKHNETLKQSSKISPVDGDPWGLSSASVKRDYQKMTSPPLEAFFWQRLVVDEFTYLAKKDRERVLEVISNIRCTFRWCLSGTPKHANFNDVSTLASLLGVHLGVDEVLPGVKLTNKYLSESETSGVESLSHYLESRSLQWHGRRHELAQAFLDRFVRQNVAEIDEIPFKEHVCMISLPAVERAIYMELETHLKSLEMNSKTAQKSKRKSTGDRESRMQRILEDSDSAEEALLKCCSQFNMSASFTALETIDDIIKLRNSEKERLEDEMLKALAAAFRQQERILDSQPDWSNVTMTGKGEVRDALQVFLAEAEAKKSVPHGADDEINDRILALVNQGEQLFESNPNEPDEYFDPSEDDINETLLFEMKHALRNHMHFVRSLTKELCGRIRSLRYIQHIRQFQINYEENTSKKKFECIICQKETSSVGVLSCCGHAGCMACLHSYACDGQCIVPNCCARVSPAHIASLDRLGVDNSVDSKSVKFGRKLSAIIQKVQEILNNGNNDRIVVFCQFDDLKALVAEALRASNIQSLQVKGTVIQQMNTLSIFQKDKLNKSDPRVLLLKMDDEQSAGLNLTNINHAIFVHPLLASTQEEYDAYETQAIGRIRRYGQKKMVHCYRFLAHDTIDTEIYEQRRSKMNGMKK